MIYFLAAIVIGYVLGCINGSQIIGKLKGIDIKNSGVKNPGASNTTILLGWKFGAIVAIIDILKAVLPVIVLSVYLKDVTVFDDEIKHLLIYLTGAFVIIGHNFPITMKFKGGKGTASVIGLILALDWKVGLISIGVLLIASILTDYLVIGVFLMYIAFILTTYFFGFGIYAVLVAILLTLMCFIKHAENIERLKNKTETKISTTFKKKKS